MTDAAHSPTAVRRRPETKVGAFSRRNGLVAYAFLAPFLVLYILLMFIPLLKGIWISLHDWDLAGFSKEFIGFGNYVELFGDRVFWTSLAHTLEFTFLTVILTSALALGLALALNRSGRTWAILRTVFFASSAFSVSVVTLIWIMMLRPNKGLLANLFESLGLEPIAFLTSTTLAMPAIVVTSVWWGIGFPLMLFLAGLQQIPANLYEAARLDNAGKWKTLFKITLPSLRRTTLLVLIFETLLHMQLFGQTLIMTQGGPSNRTRSFVQFIYENGWRDWQLGYASAASMILFLIMMGISLAQIRLNREEEDTP